MRRGPGRCRAPRVLSRAGFTLIELVVVAGILVVLASLVVVGNARVRDRSLTSLTRVSLSSTRTAILGSADHPGFRQDLGELPARVEDLLTMPATLPSGEPVASYDPVLRHGWDGPYLTPSGGRYAVDPERGFLEQYGTAGGPCVLDAWGNPIVIHAVAAGDFMIPRLVSAGPNGVLETPPSVTLTQVELESALNDDLVALLSGVDIQGQLP